MNLSRNQSDMVPVQIGRPKMSMQRHVDDIAPLLFSNAEKPERQRFLCRALIPLQIDE